jgi:microcystin-dependent protein
VWTLGEVKGQEQVTLTTNNLPSHSHTLNASTSDGTGSSPANAALGAFGTSVPPAGPYVPNGTPNATMAAGSVGNAGGSQSVSIMQPTLGLNYIIATIGIYPSHS